MSCEISPSVRVYDSSVAEKLRQYSGRVAPVEQSYSSGTKDQSYQGRRSGEYFLGNRLDVFA